MVCVSHICVSCCSSCVFLLSNHAASLDLPHPDVWKTYVYSENQPRGDLGMLDVALQAPLHRLIAWHNVCQAPVTCVEDIWFGPLNLNAECYMNLYKMQSLPIHVRLERVTDLQQARLIPHFAHDLQADRETEKLIALGLHILRHAGTRTDRNGQCGMTGQVERASVRRDAGCGLASPMAKYSRAWLAHSSGPDSGRICLLAG